MHPVFLIPVFIAGLQLAGCQQPAHAESLVIETDKAVVDLHLAFGLIGPGARASASGSIVSSMKKGADASLTIGDYRVTVTVLENNDTQFELDLSFTDEAGVHKGNEAVTVGVDRVAMFDTTIDGAIIEAVIEVVGVFDSFESYERRYE